MKTLRLLHRRSQVSRRGSTLAVVMIVMALLAAFASAAFTFSNGNTIIIQRSNAYTATVGVAEGMLEMVYSRWRDLVSYNPPSNATTTTPNFASSYFLDPANRLGRDITRVTPNDLGLPTSMMAQLGMTDADAPLGTVTIQTVDVYGRPYGNSATDSSSLRIQARPRTGTGFYPAKPSGVDYSFTADNASAKGLPGDNVIYEVKVRLPYRAVTSSGGQTSFVEMSRRFTKFYATTAQFAYFFQDNLEFTPGYNLTVDGRSHTNANLKIGPQGTSVLTFNDAVTFAGTKTETGAPVYNNGVIPSQVEALPVGGIPTESLQAAGGSTPNYNNNSLREIIERPVARTTVPGLPESTPYADYWDVEKDGSGISARQAPIEQARLYRTSGLKVLVTYDSSGKATLTVRGLNPAGMADGRVLSDTEPVVQLIKSALNNVTTTGTNGFRGASDGILTNAGRRTDMNDLRESDGGTATVGVTTLDISKFVGPAGQDLLKANYNDFNGVLYVADVTGQDAATGKYNEITDGVDRSNFETDGSDRKKHGIMLVNANKLPGNDLTVGDPSRSFTVVSDNAVYVRGDFNTGAAAVSYYTDPLTGRKIANPSTADPSYERVSASIIADSVGVVSNRYTPEFATSDKYEFLKVTATDAGGFFIDVNGNRIKYGTGAANAGNDIPDTDPYAYELYVKDGGGNPVLKRGAIPTTVNAAVVGGINDNDGAQNLMRFLENWTDPKLLGSNGTSGFENLGTPCSFPILVP